MPRPVRIGNAHGFWGDRIEAAAEMLSLEPNLDYLTLDFLAEVSMSILARQRQRDANAGYARDIVDVIVSLADYWKSGGRCRVITNAGGLNPHACAAACRDTLIEAGCRDRVIAVVSGDDVLKLLKSDVESQSTGELWNDLDTDQSVSTVIDQMITANAYLGARPVTDALARGADIVITGRVADPSLTVAACVNHYDWSWNDYDRLAGATVAGHLIECGTQVTGGISTDWLHVPNVDHMGFPIVEVDDDGSCGVTKPRGTGGIVSELTVREQLVYELGDPSSYLSPDVTVSFLPIRVEQASTDRVSVKAAEGTAPPDRYKVCATYSDGYRAAAQLTIYGIDALKKARAAADAVLRQSERNSSGFRDSLVECSRSGQCRTGGNKATGLTETVVRIVVEDDSRELVERFARSVMPLITSGPPGTTGYAEGRPRVRPVICYWPCLIECDRVQPVVEIIEALEPKSAAQSKQETPAQTTNDIRPSDPQTCSNPKTLIDIACARSGDKGIHANIGVISRTPDSFERICRELTSQRVAEWLGVEDVNQIERYEMPNIDALNFVIRGMLENSLRTDVQGKALGQDLLQIPLSNEGGKQ